MTWALVCGVPRSFERALAATPVPIDVARAQRQHAAYVAALGTLGLEIIAIPANEALPDCCFVEDTCVVANGRALLTRPGAPSRRAEVQGVAQVLDGRIPLVRMTEPATLDGGDCLRIGDTMYVGRSARSNDAGRAQLAAALGVEVVPVDLPPGVLHLKSVCSPLGDGAVLVAEGTLPESTFRGARVISVPRDEAHAANAVAWGGAALIAAACARTRSLVEAAGVQTIEVDTSELRKADGALTCLCVVLAGS